MENIERIAALYPTIIRGMSRIRSLVHDGMDLSYNQYKTLLTVYDRGGSSLNALATELDVATSSASEMVERLVNLGLLTRRPAANNRRQIVISTTQEGATVVATLQAGIVNNYRRLLDHLPEEEQGRLVAGLEMLASVFEHLETLEKEKP